MRKKMRRNRSKKNDALIEKKIDQFEFFPASNNTEINKYEN